MSEVKNKKKKSSIIQVSIGVLAVILAILIIIMMGIVSDIQGTARIVNYTGLVRGETQRLIKLELSTQQENERLVAGILSEKMKKDIKSLYISLIAAMLCGRIVWGLVSAAVYAFTGGIFTWELFLMGGFINALPGILIQLVLIPALVERLYNMEGTVEWN